jgi:hypothetical protein
MENFEIIFKINRIERDYFLKNFKIIQNSKTGLKGIKINKFIILVIFKIKQKF